MQTTEGVNLTCAISPVKVRWATHGKNEQAISENRENLLEHSVSNHTDTVVALLEQLSEHFDGNNNTEARRWHGLLTKQSQITANNVRNVVFVGEVGVGKSSALAVTAGLLLDGEKPLDKSSLRRQSMLPTGAGRTTLCEVESRGHREGEDISKYGVLLTPIPLEEMHEIVRLWAEDEWGKRHNYSPSGAEVEVISNSQEISRALRQMVGYAEYRDGTGARQTIHPLDEVAKKYVSADELEKHLVERLRLPQRKQTEWWFDSENARTDIKAVLEQINSGASPSALLPQRLTLVIPKFLENLEDGKLKISFIDSRGLDGGVRLESRPDIQKFIENPLAILVLCAPFKSAPGDSIREFLRAINGDARWSSAKQRIVFALLDQGDAELVNGADGDRLAGLDIKKDECIADLQHAQILEKDEALTITALDVLLDHSENLREEIKDAVRRLGSQLDDELKDIEDYVQEFLSEIQDSARVQLLPGVNQQIRQVLSENIPDGTPLLDPIRGALNAVQMTQYPATVFAACRRRGRYRDLDLYEAIASAAASAATAWITPSIRKVMKKLDALIESEEFALVRSDLKLHRLRFSESRLAFVRNYAEAVKNEIAPLLEKDRQLWTDCASNWGLSNGFKGRVQEILRQWSERQVLKEHLELDSKTSDIPFWSILQSQKSAPKFSVIIKNLRALKNADFSPESVSLLIGANGAGKTTLLHSLKLLRLGYERGFSDAIRIVLGGIYEIKNWFSNADDEIEIGIKIGEAQWIIYINTESAGLDVSIKEKLFYQDTLIFSCDASRNINYLGVQLYSSREYTALKFLIDRGEIHPAIQLVSDVLGRISVFEDPDLTSLRQLGSPAFDDQQLQMRGQNALSVLRRWKQDSQLRDRFEFVNQGLQAAFPSVREMDFVGAGNMLAARIYHVGVERPSPLANEANGLLQMIVLLTNLAQSETGGIVAIDEPENSLHPYAARVFLRSCQQWALKHSVTFILATHSLVLLDEFTHTPEAVFVIRPHDKDRSVPSSLDMVFNRDWLEGFKLGDLYEQGEIGSNDDGGL